MQANSAVTRELTEMHEQTQSIHQQSDQYVDESELPFTTAPVPLAEDADVFVAGSVLHGEPRAHETREPREKLDSAAG
jgi:hypothetical protein